MHLDQAVSRVVVHSLPVSNTSPALGSHQGLSTTGWGPIPFQSAKYWDTWKNSSLASCTKYKDGYKQEKSYWIYVSQVKNDKMVKLSCAAFIGIITSSAVCFMLLVVIMTCLNRKSLMKGLQKGRQNTWFDMYVAPSGATKQMPIAGFKSHTPTNSQQPTLINSSLLTNTTHRQNQILIILCFQDSDH